MVPKIKTSRLTILPLFVLLAALTACGGPFHRQGQYSATAGQRAAPGGEASYVVQAGDTVYGIARRHGLDVTQLAERNGLAAPYTIQPGQVLTLPGTAPTNLASATTDIVPSAAPVETVSASPLPAVSAQPLAPQGASQETIVESTTVTTVETTTTQPAPAPAVLPGAPQPIAPQPIAVEPISSAPGEPQLEATPSLQPDEPPLPQQATAVLPDPPARAGSKFIWPVDGTLLSGYGPKADGMRNDGINIGAPEGAPVKAAENGVVAYAGQELRGFGNLILIKHQDDYVTAYAH
ncbi:MAG TPA: M23 family metallopeptidase, partial [Kiloniellales bacterium]|nr:M23 family metallopeptidase [Kiloniellales bacterium]